METLSEILAYMRSIADPAVALKKAKKFNIPARNAIGVYQSAINEVVKLLRTNSPIQKKALALELYATEIHEARLLAAKIYPPKLLDKKWMDIVVADITDWETCDTFCMVLFAPSEFALEKIYTWIVDEREFVRRAGLVVMAAYGFSRKKEPNTSFTPFFDLLLEYDRDDRNFGKKANNWALRQIGKRNTDLCAQAILTAEKMLEKNTKSATWIAKDALRELQKDGLKFQDYPRDIYRK